MSPPALVNGHFFRPVRNDVRCYEEVDLSSPEVVFFIKEWLSSDNAANGPPGPRSGILKNP